MKDRGIPTKPQRSDRTIRERVHDPYKTRLKLPEPTVCPQCGALYHAGRWTWAERPTGEVHEELCQACHRANDRYPAGLLTLRGAFIAAHKGEILELARNTEKKETGEHPLHRIMGVDERSDEVEITTTDIHLPRRIGEALHRAFEGDFDFHYDEEGYFLRASWVREK
jgi:hypothetical protein